MASSTVIPPPRPRLQPPAAPGPPAPGIAVRDLHRGFGPVRALDGVTLSVARGEVHALLGRNGAGKTTLLRVLGGLADPTHGTVAILGRDASAGSRALRGAVGLVPSGDRSFYLRISGLENLVFFARLQGLRRRAARARAVELLAVVDLLAVADRPVGAYSHGMQKRLSFARALIAGPAVLLIDEATHDLDPAASRQVRAIAAELAAGGTAVLWATQRIEELRGFADRVTVLDAGRVRFAGSLAGLLEVVDVERHVLRLAGPLGAGLPRLQAALGSSGRLDRAPDGDPRALLLRLAPGRSIGAALSALVAAGCDVTGCREERPQLEEAFLSLTRPAAA